MNTLGELSNYVEEQRERLYNAIAKVAHYDHEGHSCDIQRVISEQFDAALKSIDRDSMQAGVPWAEYIALLAQRFEATAERLERG